MTSLIRTVSGDVPAGKAGPTYVHEHLIIDSPLVSQRWPEIHLHSVSEAVAEVETCHRAGVRMMVDAMPAASGRDPVRLAEVSARTEMMIVAVTGLHTSKYYDDVPWTWEESPEELAQRFTGDIEIGIDRHDFRGLEVNRTSFRAGVIKVAALTEAPTDRDLRLFQAAAITSATTGAPILTHTEGGKGGRQQIETLLGMGVPPTRLALSHTDKVTDATYHRELLSSGVFLCYDQALRWTGENHTARLVAAMIAEGFGAQIMLGTDGARRSLWATLGGSPGLAWLHDGFLDLLRAEGVTPDQIEALFVTNPARFLSLSPA